MQKSPTYTKISPKIVTSETMIYESMFCKDNARKSARTSRTRNFPKQPKPSQISDFVMKKRSPQDLIIRNFGYRTRNA